VSQPSKAHPPGRRRGFRAGIRFRAEWRKSARFLRRHREDVALLFGVAAITFSLIGTCNSLDQVAIQRNSLMPQLGVSGVERAATAFAQLGRAPNQCELVHA